MQAVASKLPEIMTGTRLIYNISTSPQFLNMASRLGFFFFHRGNRCQFYCLHHGHQQTLYHKNALCYTQNKHPLTVIVSRYSVQYERGVQLTRWTITLMRRARHHPSWGMTGLGCFPNHVGLVVLLTEWNKFSPFISLFFFLFFFFFFFFFVFI